MKNRRKKKSENSFKAIFSGLFDEFLDLFVAIFWLWMATQLVLLLCMLVFGYFFYSKPDCTPKAWGSLFFYSIPFLIALSAFLVIKLDRLRLWIAKVAPKIQGAHKAEALIVLLSFVAILIFTILKYCKIFDLSAALPLDDADTDRPGRNHAKSLSQKLRPTQKSGNLNKFKKGRKP